MPAKLTIAAYKTNTYVGQPVETFSVLISPTSYKNEHKINYNEDVSGSPETHPTIKREEREMVSFDIYFDGTGGMSSQSSVDKLSIDFQIRAFKKVCYSYNGDIHTPNYLIINWGSLVFKCRLASLDLKYTLFLKNGSPLRAEASCVFTKVIDAPV